MIYPGVALLVLGGLAALRESLVGAWPSPLPWVLMGCGLLLIAVGLGRRRRRWRYVAAALFALFVLGLAGAWLLG